MQKPTHPEQSIAGQWRTGRGSFRVPVVDPASEAVIAEYPAADAEDIADALAATTRGFVEWSHKTALERSDVLRQSAALIRQRGNDIAWQLTWEQGKPLAEALREVEQAAQMIEWNAEEGRRAYGRVIPSRLPNIELQTQVFPIGPVAAFTPWNFPVMLSAIKVSAALAAGCSVILKPADETPSAVAWTVRCFHDAGVVPEALQMLMGNPAEISRSLIDSSVIRKVSFTGSPHVGRLLAQQAGQALKPITLELGGHAPVVVCEDADLERTVAALAQIKLRNAGQICANPSRFYVHRSLYPQFLDAFVKIARNTSVGPGSDPSSQMGPLANARRLAAVSALVEDARAKGARVLCGGERMARPGFFYLPTVLADVPQNARVFNEEPFGPLIPVAPFDTLEEAIDQSNRLSLGLAAFGFTRSLSTARRLTQSLRAGAVAINCVTLMQPETPFGGVQDSGYGRENGHEGVLAYTSVKAVAIAS